MASDKEETEPRYPGLQIGQVVEDVDPMGLGRVKLIVHGIIEHPTWAFPLGLAGAGGPQRGSFAVPPKGADVGVFFQAGDPERPYYMGGNYGAAAGGDEVPEDVKAAPREERHKIAAHDTEFWKWSIDDREGKNALRFQHKKLDLAIEIDGAKGVVEIRGEAAINFKARGQLVIDAPNIVIGGRTVMKNGKPIS